MIFLKCWLYSEPMITFCLSSQITIWAWSKSEWRHQMDHGLRYVLIAKQLHLFQNVQKLLKQSNISLQNNLKKE